MIFSSIYTQQLNHIINEELSNDLNHNKKLIYTEKNVDSFINHLFPINQNPCQIINGVEMIKIIKKEILSFRGILIEFNDYLKDNI